MTVRYMYASTNPSTGAQEVSFGEMVGGARSYYSFELFMEMRDEGDTFRVYGKGGLNLKLLVVSLPSCGVEGPTVMRAEQGWTVQTLKEAIARVSVCVCVCVHACV